LIKRKGEAKAEMKVMLQIKFQFKIHQRQSFPQPPHQIHSPMNGSKDPDRDLPLAEYLACDQQRNSEVLDNQTIIPGLGSFRKSRNLEHLQRMEGDLVFFPSTREISLGQSGL
jgi:hypothetical protein